MRTEREEPPGGAPPPPNVAGALAQRIAGVTYDVPRRADVAAVMDALLGALFPQLSDEPVGSAPRVASRLQHACGEVGRILSTGALADHGGVQVTSEVAAAMADAFLEALPAVHRSALEDAEAILAGDPAARSLDEVVAAYPGFLAIAVQRLAHVLHALDVPVVPRLMTEVAHARTGIDIHPGATIGSSFCIDHGTGVVIGETAVIGDHVKLYQGVTLGALSVSKRAAGTKRHPTIGDRVVIYANATILGGDTIVGADSVIGGNVFLTSSVPPGSLVYQTSSYRVRRQEDGFDGADFVI
jgi:serine O-acetyltransferase